MEYRLEALLDRCLSELKQGRDLEDILEAHPDAADELRPLLATAAWAALHVPPHRHAQVHKRAVMAAVEDRRRLVESVDGYVNEVRAGVSYSDIVARAPEGLSAVVMAAWRMKYTPIPVRDADRVAEGKARVIALAAARRRAQHQRVALRDHLREGLAGLAHGLLPRPSAARRMRSATASGLATLVLAAGLVGVNTAAADSVPGQPFYGVKRFGEAAQLLLASDQGKAALIIRFSERRLAEMRALAENGRAVPADLAAEWLDGHARAWDQIQRLPWDQRELLTEMLLASLESPPADLAGTALPHDLADSLRASLGLGDPAGVAAPLLGGQPVVREQVLPAEESEPATDADEETAPVEGAADPVAVDAPAPPPVVVAPPVVSVPPADDGDGDDPAAPPVDEPAVGDESTAPPQFGVPPVSPDPDSPPEGGSENP